MERAIQIYAIVNLTVIGISHVARPREWVDLFVLIREHTGQLLFDDSIKFQPFCIALNGARLGQPVGDQLRTDSHSAQQLAGILPIGKPTHPSLQFIQGL